MEPTTSKNAPASKSTANTNAKPTSNTPVVGAEAELQALKKQLAQQGERLPQASDDVVGYCETEECPVHCLPLNVKMFDSSIDKTKPSILISVRLLSPTLIKTADKDDPVKRLAKKGEVVGVWYKPGMRAIRNKAGVETYIAFAGEKDTGKGNPMKMYDVRGTDGRPLPVVEDARVKSADTKTVFDLKQDPTERTPTGPAADEIPF